MDKEQSANLLDKAARICITKHSGQRDKMGRAYFQHPMRVAMRCATDEQKMVALLHDVIEDCGVTADELLAEGFPQEVIEGIVAVTRQDGESYEEFVARAKQNPLGRAVKLHDLEDNLDIFRLDTLSPEMAARFSRYLAAYRFLQSDDTPDPGKRPAKIKTVDELYSILRAEEDNRTRSRSGHTGGTDYMRNRLIIRDKDRTVIDESNIFDTLVAVGRLIGFDKIYTAGVMAQKGRFNYKLVRHSTLSECYKRDTSGWMVLSNIPVVSAALALNHLFDKLNARYIASVVDR